MKRRRLLASTGGAVVTAFAGCLSNNEADDEDSNPSDNNNSSTDNDDTEPEEGLADGFATFQPGELTDLEYGCTSSKDNRLESDEPVVGAHQLAIVVSGQVFVENPESYYPTVVDFSQNVEENSIRVVTGFTDEVPEGYDPAFHAYDHDGAECVEQGYYIRPDFSYVFEVEEGEELEGGIDVQWDIEYPDGTVEEAIATDQTPG